MHRILDSLFWQNIFKIYNQTSVSRNSQTSLYNLCHNMPEKIVDIFYSYRTNLLQTDRLVECWALVWFITTSINCCLNGQVRAKIKTNVGAHTLFPPPHLANHNLATINDYLSIFRPQLSCSNWAWNYVSPIMLPVSPIQIDITVY